MTPHVTEAVRLNRRAPGSCPLPDGRLLAPDRVLAGSWTRRSTHRAPSIGATRPRAATLSVNAQLCYRHWCLGGIIWEISDKMPRATDDDLLYVSKGSKERLDTLAAGVHLENRTGYTVETLRAKVVTDRLELARSILGSAENSVDLPAPSFRTAVSRAYYAMYHATRALSYFVHGGDDQQEHSKLPASIPHDFPSRSHWENELKHARLERNRADYDPYPKNDRRFENAAKDLIRHARDFIPRARHYLRSKGWRP